MPLFVLAFTMGAAVLIPINTGLRPKRFFYLAAFRASLAGVTLAALMAVELAAIPVW